MLDSATGVILDEQVVDAGFSPSGTKPLVAPYPSDPEPYGCCRGRI
ncbi:hypothetical protein [Prescottella agglutinans]